MRSTSLLAPCALLFAAAAALADDPAASTPPTEPTLEPAPDAPAPPPTDAPPTDAPAAPAAPPPTPTTPPEAAPDEPVAAPQRAPTAGPQIEGPRDGVPNCRPGAAACIVQGDFALWPRLRVRAGYEFVQPDAALATVGNNDGFFLDQTRIGLDGAWRDELRYRLILDVVSVVPGGAPNDPVQPITSAVRDAWVAWIPSDWFFVSAGQQFMPSDLEGSSTLAGLPFARRSAATSGVRPGHGFAVAGLSPSRQMSVVVGSTEKAGFGPVGVEYLLGIGNGNGQNVLGNDNKLPAVYGRVGAGFASGDDLRVRVGAGGRYNTRTIGTNPNLFDEADTVGFADVSVAAFGLNLAAQGIYKQTEFLTLLPDAGEGAVDTGLGATAWVFVDAPFGLDTFGIIPAYRFSYYDPSSTVADDQLLENTLGVRWNIPVAGLPLSLFVDGTLLTEFGEGVRDLDNARATALLQLEL